MILTLWPTSVKCLSTFANINIFPRAANHFPRGRTFELSEMMALTYHIIFYVLFILAKLWRIKGLDTRRSLHSADPGWSADWHSEKVAFPLSIPEEWPKSGQSPADRWSPGGSPGVTERNEWKLPCSVWSFPSVHQGQWNVWQEVSTAQYPVSAKRLY